MCMRERIDNRGSWRKKKETKSFFDSRLIITSIWKKIYIVTISTFIDLHI